ncbi:MAG: sulfatase [Bacteroidota bacterium]
MPGINKKLAFKSTMFFALVLLFKVAALSQSPNIIFIMSDDMGYGDLGCYGNKVHQTPNLDKLASQGIKMVNAYAAAPLCTPTRTALMTGRYPAKTPVGIIEPLTGSPGDRSYGLTSEVPSLATLIKSAGYKTALVGKWHLGVLPQHSPVKNGFDYFYGFLDGAADYVSHNSRGQNDLFENDTPVDTEGYLTDLFTQKAISFIRQKHTKPFFLALTFNAPHWPWQAPGAKPYDDSVDFRKGGSADIYSAMIKSMDDGIGKLLQALDEAKLSQNTIIIFTNDNGGERYSDNGGLSQSKGTLWEGGIRVPAFVRWPGKIPAGTVTNQVAVSMDWTATILAAAKAKSSKDYLPDGIDLLPVLTGSGEVSERTIFWRTFQRTKQKAVRMGDWKYLQDEKGEYLFNLAVDQAEKNNLKDMQQPIIDSLRKQYAAWESQVLKPVSL